MFYALYRDENKELKGGVYFSYNKFHKDTFNPSTEIITLFEFKLHGGTYAERKASARELAIEWQNCEKQPMYYSEWSVIGGYFEDIGRRYGLLTEFIENGIC